MKLKPWIMWTIASICFALVSVMYFIEKKYSLAIVYAIIALSYIMITISNYKNPNESNKNVLPDIELKALDNELIDLIKKGKHVKAIKKYRVATGAGLVKAKEHIDFLSKVEI